MGRCEASRRQAKAALLPSVRARSLVGVRVDRKSYFEKETETWLNRGVYMTEEQAEDSFGSQAENNAGGRLYVSKCKTWDTHG